MMGVPPAPFPNVDCYSDDPEVAHRARVEHLKQLREAIGTIVLDQKWYDELKAANARMGVEIAVLRARLANTNCKKHGSASHSICAECYYPALVAQERRLFDQYSKDHDNALRVDNDRLLNLCKSIHYQYCADTCPAGDHHNAACLDIGGSINPAKPKLLRDELDALVDQYCGPDTTKDPT